MEEQPIKYSIILTYYRESVEDELTLCRCLYSLKDAVMHRKDVEILVIHDGPVELSIHTDILPNCMFYKTTVRENVWGHNSRNYGLKIAKGKFIFHGNFDNIYYPDFLNVLDKEIEEDVGLYIFSCRMRGWGCDMYGTRVAGKTIHRRTDTWKLFNPKEVKLGTIDCMQVATRKELWKDGWSDYSIDSDGKYYESFAKITKTKNVNCCIGEHY